MYKMPAFIHVLLLYFYFLYCTFQEAYLKQNKESLANLYQRNQEVSVILEMVTTILVAVSALISLILNYFSGKKWFS